ncbi:MAG: hypothetical protein GY731_19960, partial [Gammaproteobacteria bacterium]|nr:hypothetical protein [Gammaproteobacteria bacterium]
AMGEQARSLNDLVGFFTVEQTARGSHLKVVKGKGNGKAAAPEQPAKGRKPAERKAPAGATNGTSAVKDEEWEEF